MLFLLATSARPPPISPRRATAVLQAPPTPQKCTSKIQSPSSTLALRRREVATYFQSGAFWPFG